MMFQLHQTVRTQPEMEHDGSLRSLLMSHRAAFTHPEAGLERSQ
jgi:hypothetical protein